ncbi:MAG: hypothetical protein COB84_02150 [Rhodobacteraceae bacterium]|nr:MAG: hypothetical protein COB84_02150 [Paracoccaceae bacterium]
MKKTTVQNGYLTVSLETAHRLPDQPFVGLVNGADAPLLPLDLPAGLKGLAREKVAQRILAGNTATSLHPFASKPHVAPWTHAIVVSDENVAQWRETFQVGTSRCVAILPDYLALPCAKDVWVIEVAGDQARVRLGQTDGFSADIDMVAILLAKATPPKAVLRLGTSAHSIDDLIAELGVPVCDSVKALAKIAPSVLPAFSNGELLFDLGKDPRAAFNAQAKTLKSWAVPVILAVLALGLWTGAELYSSAKITTQTTEIRKETVDAVRAMFVPDGPILDVKAQVTQALVARQNATSNASTLGSPLELLKATGAVINASGVTLDVASYSETTGLAVTLKLSDFAALDQVVDALKNAGFNVKIERSSSIDGGGVEAILAVLNAAKEQ